MDDIEQPAGAETPAADVAVAEQPEATVETNSEATAEQPAEAETSETGDDAAAAPKKKHWAHERIDELTRQKHEALREADYWRSKANVQPDYDNLEFEEGIAERVSQRNRQEQAETAQETAHRLALETFNYREAEARDKYADYDAVTRSPSLPITQAMAELIVDSELGPEIAYHLGKNPAEVTRLAALPAPRLAREIGRLEERLTAPKPLPKQPSPPVRPVGGIKAGGQKDPGQMTMAEYKAWREAQ